MDQVGQNETGVGVGGVVGRMAAWNAVIRGGQNRRAILYGSMQTESGRGFRNFGKAIFGARATDEEFIRRRSRSHFGSLGTPYSMSRMTAGLQILNGGDGAYTRQVMKMWAPAGHVSALNAHNAAAGRGAFGLGADVAGYEKGVGQYLRTADNHWVPFKNINQAFYKAPLAGAERYHAIDRLMGLGKYKNTWGNLGTRTLTKEGFTAADFIVGSVLKPETFGRLSGKTALETAGLYIKGVGARGAAVRAAGTLGTKAALTTGGHLLSVANPVIAGAVLAKDMYDITKLATEGVYNLGEAYFYKIPKRFYQETNRVATRDIGMSPSGLQFISQTASNRARAVQAIQGSRLNARNALGNEAGLLAGHFG